ncbi:MAG: peptidase [Desulfobacteraceae bacterium 4572_88]|nr:MAG: peptidase [Desulfobacteraceae bacterium 4572_88]
MINKFRHKGLERFFAKGTKAGIAGIQASHAERLHLILARLNASTSPGDMNLPELGLHELSGDRKGACSVKVSGSWRITFTFPGKNACDVNYED